MLCPFCDERELVINVPGLKFDSGSIIRNGIKVPMPPQQIKILECLAIKFPKMASLEHIVIWTYESRDEPEDALSSIRVQMHRLRRNIHLLNLRVKSYHSLGYQLIDESEKTHV